MYVLSGVFTEYCNLSKIRPWGDELKWVLKEGGGRIFQSCDISRKYAHLTRS